MLAAFQCQAQIVEEAAPWRLGAEDDVDFLLIDMVDLNSASLADLLNIPSMDITIAAAIIEHRETVATFSDLNELRSIKGVNSANFDLICQYLYIEELDSTSQVHQISRYSIQHPYSESVEKGAFKFGQKFFIKNNDNVTLGLATEKDPGEVEFWDHATLSLKLPLFENRGELFLGDFTVSSGHGLVINTRRNFGLGWNADSNIRFRRSTLKSYYSWDESVALRGIGTTIKIPQATFTAWLSQRNRDTYVDTNDNITSFDLSGLHRTEVEDDRNNAVLENTWGTRITIDGVSDRITAGATVINTGWNKNLIHGSETLKNTFAGSFDLVFSWNSTAATLETAFDDSWNTALMGTVQLKYRMIKHALALYTVSPDYYSPLSSSLDFDLGEVQNRQGMYSHISLKVPQGRLNGFAHLYRFPRRLPGQSWGGQDLFLQWEENLGRGWESNFTSRWTQEEDADSFHKTRKWRARSSMNFTPGLKWSLQTYLKVCSAPEVQNLGKMLGIEAHKVWNLTKKLTLNFEVRTAAYDADGYEVRLYWIDYDISRSMRSRPLWGSGIAFQCQGGVSHQVLGQLQIQLFWDQPENHTNRSPSKCFVIIYKFG